MKDCIIKENDLIDYAIKLGHNVVAITDHESISSWIKVEKYYSKVKKDNPDFKVIRGNEIYLCRDGLNAENFNKENDKYYHFILLAKDLAGAKQIMELSTRAWLRSYMGTGLRRVPTYYQDLIDIIKPNPGHVIASSACIGGSLANQILRGFSLQAMSGWIYGIMDIFGKDNFFLEMQPSNNEEQIIVNKWIVNNCNKFGLNYIITTDSHYLKLEDREIHKAYLNSQDGEREIDDFYSSTYMMDTDELEKYFGYLSKEEIYRAYESIQKIGEMCEDFSLMKPLKIPQLNWENQDINISLEEKERFYQKIPYLTTFSNSKFVGDNELAKAIIKGIKNHKDLQNQEAYEEINKCLEMTWVSSEVNKAHWSSYFLNLQKIVNECWNSGTLVGCGRGSGVGFILLYLLDITQINPLRETTQTFRWRLTRIESKAS